MEQIVTNVINILVVSSLYILVALGFSLPLIEPSDLNAEIGFAVDSEKLGIDKTLALFIPNARPPMGLYRRTARV